MENQYLLQILSVVNPAQFYRKQMQKVNCRTAYFVETQFNKQNDTVLITRSFICF